ncbi:SGNH/GDSL hydrolase family protein [Bradyrhizobium aeschynomenes]|uniref:SGNH/GDSL hydrolase family protein n=1 Tax=Bradyrhizobium aeschynomenes TaxID=2734909 RepID=UPI0015553098|nr:SGNH/GDSL hydrolase family protein [Bradyrhizobium aeschynomenes]NPV19362.1 SGNH/GDSL hydrolase family protein [Bradyrhizobium aeschynomenes]
MRRVILLAASLSMVAALPLPATAAAGGQACPVADDLVQATFPMPNARSAAMAQRLDIAVVGSGSSMLAGKAGPDRAYPKQLESALAAQLPGVAVDVIVYARSQESASEQERSIVQLLAARKPSMVIWQTGTVDAIRVVDAEEFGSAVERGVAALQAQNVDVVLMNMQFSPRTQAMIAIGPYADQIRHLALQNSANLFDRLAVMKDWNERGTFDLSAETRSTDVAEEVHACIGKLLARLIVQGMATASHSNSPATE